MRNFHKGKYKYIRKCLAKLDLYNMLRNKTAVECWNILKYKPPGCGKNTFVTRLLRHPSTMIDAPPEKTTWNYGEWQTAYATINLPDLQFAEGLLVQNLFPKNKETRTISLNAHYMVVFKNPRDKSQISHLTR